MDSNQKISEKSLDPNRTYYTYKITASDSDKYYYGVTHVKKSNASRADCEAHKYMGSGGPSSKNLFRKWKALHKEKLKKEILAIFSSKEAAYHHEQELVGDLWFTDKLCLNGKAGGFMPYIPKESYSIATKECLIHGFVLHRAGGSCFSCTNSTEIKVCGIHGETPFQSGDCAKCKAVMPKNKKCPEHGNTLHRGSVCLNCAEANPGELLCEPHELPIHKKDYLNRCLGCIAQNIGIDKCEIHQEVHRWGGCQSCKKLEKAEKIAILAELKLERIAERKRQLEIKRNTTKIVVPTFTTRQCPTHGTSTFRKNLCTKCQTISAITEKECPTHGLTKHQGLVCAKCSAQDSYSLKICTIHGESKFSGNSCATCRAETGVKTVECPIHGQATSIGNRCRLCVNQKSVMLKLCSVHGMSKHQGDKCSSCSSMATAHRLHHGRKLNKKCHLCVESNMGNL